MKLSKLFFGVAAAAMFAACSSDELVQEQAQPQWDAEGNGYMAFNVSMPQPPSSRANDVFEDGLPEEFKVKNVILALFKAPDDTHNDEAHATCISAYTVDQTDFADVTEPNVTSDRLIVKKIVHPGTDLNVYALVILNHNNLFSVADDKLKYKTTEFTGKISDLQALTAADVLASPGNLDNSASAFHADGFLMTNAPLYTKPGGTTNPFVAGNVQVLAPVNVNAIKKTKAEASSEVAANVYVERAVAKVTMKKPISATTHAATAPNMTGFEWTAASWKLDNTNKKSFLVRNTAGFEDWDDLQSKATGVTDYRFVGETSVAHTGSSLGIGATTALYRTYFAKDPNYNTFDGDLTNEYNRDASDTGLSEDFGLEKPQYCAENTFDVAHQIWDHTTRVILKTTLTTTGSHFGRPGDDGFLTVDAVKVIAYNKALAAYEQEYAALSAENQAKISGTITYNPALVSLGAGTVSVTFDGSLAATGSAGEPAFDLVEKYMTDGADITDLGDDIQYYPTVDGSIPCYYQARIKHFGDDLTPWNGTGATKEWKDGNQPEAGGVAKIYPDADGRRDANYLGRWGMLRNNWYDLNINSINKLGYPTPGELSYGTTTDDEIESWISVDVNILSWARREQNINF